METPHIFKVKQKRYSTITCVRTWIFLRQMIKLKHSLTASPTSPCFRLWKQSILIGSHINEDDYVPSDDSDGRKLFERGLILRNS